jgi:hypothetical protein
MWLHRKASIDNWNRPRGSCHRRRRRRFKDRERGVPVKAQLLSSSTVKADCPSRLPQGLAGAINATLSPQRHVPADEEHAPQRCDPRIEDLNDQLTATDTL